MTFLNPLVLIALAAAAIPIILHLLNLRKARLVEFSTLSFIKELQRSKIRKLKIRQWLLLALRTLIIVFIVLAFTRPAMRSAFGFLPGATAKSSVVIILDDSFSMLATDDRGQLFRQAKDKAASILDMLNPGDEALLIRTSEAGRQEYAFTAAIAAVRKELASAQPSFIRSDYVDALTAAGVAMQKSGNINREVYLLTDQQRSSFAKDPRFETKDFFKPDVRLVLIPFGGRSVDNIAVVDARVENSLFETNRAVDVTATVANYGRNAVSSGIVSVFLNGERVQQKTVDVDPGGQKQIELIVTPREAGFNSGFVELENDLISEDNRRYFSFYVPTHVRALIASAGSRPAELITLALQPSTEAGGGAFGIEGVEASRLAVTDLAKFDVVVLADGSSAIGGATLRLAAWVENGGGLIIFPDANGQISTLTGLLPQLGIPAPKGTNGSLGSQSAYTSFGKIDFDHPLFRNIFETSQPGKKPEVESPKLYYSLRLTGTEASQTVVSTSGGDAFLLDHRKGKGRVLVYAVSPDFTWSDLPLRGVFVPLMNRSVHYLASTEEAAASGTVGVSLEVSVPTQRIQSGPYEVFTPGGTNDKIQPRILSSGSVFAIEHPSQPGVYRITGGSVPLREAVVNTDARESDMARLDGKEQDAFFSQFGLMHVTRLNRDNDVQQAVSEIRYGVELWKYMILLAIICALLEMLIARDSKRAAEPLPIG